MQTYIGIMSGTSLDGIDIVALQLEHQPSWRFNLLAHRSYPLAESLVQTLQSMITSHHTDLLTLGEIDCRLGQAYAEACLAFIKETGLNKAYIQAIGCHGQTIFHAPNSLYPFSLQLGDLHVLAQQTGLPVIGQFRQKDIAQGGQGAPLIPAFHAVLASRTKPCAFLNLGGIANLSYIDAQQIMGFDTGPANTLMDNWCYHHHGKRYDKDGQFAASGTVDKDLLAELLNDPFIHQKPPKSTGREHFNLNWLTQHMQRPIAPADVQATLAEYTAETIYLATQHLPSIEKLYIFGGGIANQYLMSRLRSKFTFELHSTKELGIEPQAMEASAFAWLAYAYDHDIASNAPTVTGASRATVLGAKIKPN